MRTGGPPHHTSAPSPSAPARQAPCRIDALDVNGNVLGSTN